MKSLSIKSAMLACIFALQLSVSAQAAPPSGSTNWNYQMARDVCQYYNWTLYKITPFADGSKEVICVEIKDGICPDGSPYSYKKYHRTIFNRRQAVALYDLYSNGGTLTYAYAATVAAKAIMNSLMWGPYSPLEERLVGGGMACHTDKTGLGFTWGLPGVSYGDDLNNAGN